MAKSVKTRNNGTMTEAAYFSWIRSGLRRLSTYWKPKNEAMLSARKPVTGKRHKHEYLCASCGGWFKRSEVEADHIVEAGSLKCYNDLPTFVERLFVEKDGYQCLCKPCHLKKTKEDL
jgi:hypothetical protein